MVIKIEAHQNKITDISISNDGLFAVTTSIDKTAKVF